MPLTMRRIAPLRQIVIDAGPLIGFFYAKDTHHSVCVAGLTQLAASKTEILAPLPIIFEVYKWLLQKLQLNNAPNRPLNPPFWGRADTFSGKGI
jgi:predicted nucleic acid-binding protein